MRVLGLSLSLSPHLSLSLNLSRSLSISLSLSLSHSLSLSLSLIKIWHADAFLMVFDQATFDRMRAQAQREEESFSLPLLCIKSTALPRNHASRLEDVCLHGRDALQLRNGLSEWCTGNLR